jgi:hypothetical protein
MQVKEKLKNYKVGFIEAADSDYVVMDAWIYYSIIIHATFDAQKDLQCDGFLEEDANLLEEHKGESAIPLNKHVDKWLSEDKDVVSFRYHNKESK